MKLIEVKDSFSQKFKILFLSVIIGSFAGAVVMFAFSSPGVNQPPNGNPIFWLLSGTSMYYSGGSVGIGTSTPSVSLEVNGRVKDKTGYLDPTGSVISYAGSTAPQGWLMCNGAAVSRTIYADLFAMIGTTYGVGDGSTTFNIPDLRGVFVRGAGASGKLTNANGAAFSGTLGTYQNDEFQGHWHTLINGANGGSSYNEWVEAGRGNSGKNTDAYAGAAIVDGANGTPRTGAETNPANLSLNYIIKY